MRKQATMARLQCKEEKGREGFWRDGQETQSSLWHFVTAV